MAVASVEVGGLHVMEPVGSTRVGSWHVLAWPDDVPEHGLVALRVPLPVPPGTRYLRNGWQSWSAPVTSRLGGRVTRPTDPVKAAMHHWFATAPYDGDESYDVLAADGFVAGVTWGGAVLVARPSSGDLLAVRESGGPHPPVWYAEGDADPLLADLLGRCAGRVPDRLPVGWSTWTAHGERITTDVLAASVRVARGLAADGLLDLVAIDDGYQPAVGDWDAGPAFPRGLRALAGDVREAGLAAGLWLAPFVAAPASRVVTEHPEWLLRDPTGAPVPVVEVDHWGGIAWALDVTRPDVLDHVAATVRRLVADGFDYLKLDFLYAGALAGAPARPAPADVRLRRALSTLREAAGETTFLVGCGCPLWPAIGVVDAMRIGPDVPPTWAPRTEPGGDPDRAACLSNGWRAARLRGPTNGRLWAADPDAVTLRRLRPPADDDLTPSERSGFADWVAGSGQLLFDSDWLTDLRDADRARWADLVALHRGAATRTQPLEERFAPPRVPLPRPPADGRALPLAEGLWLVAGAGVSHPWDANAYLVTHGRRPLLVDCGSSAGAPAVLRNLASCGVAPEELVAVVGTHGHWDHVSGAAALGREGVPLLVGSGDLDAVRKGDPVRTTASLLYGTTFPPMPDAQPLPPGAVFDCGDATLRALPTPGHSPGSTCFLLELPDRRVLIAGDTLFGGYSDDIGSDLPEWRASLERLAALDVDLLSWGHGPPRLLGDARRRLREAASALGRFLDPWFKPFHTRFVY